MYNVIGDIKTMQNAARSKGLYAASLPKEKALILNNALVRKYTHKKDGLLCWGNLKNGCELIEADDEIYDFIPGFIGEKRCIMLIPDKGAIAFESGAALMEAYEESYECTELYVTDDNISYLLCYCHESVFFALGSAEIPFKEYCENRYPKIKRLKDGYYEVPFVPFSGVSSLKRKKIRNFNIRIKHGFKW